MKNEMTVKKMWTTVVVAMGLLLVGQSAFALDAAYSRKGPFTGVGLGGGAAIFSDGEVAGDLGLNLQLGLGASEKLTVSLNLDSSLQVNNDIAMAMIVPGPRFAVFLSKNFYLSAGVGLALALGAEPANENTVGMDAGLAVGYEHFVNTNIAAYISAGVDYYLLNDANDLVAVTIGLGIRYY